MQYTLTGFSWLIPAYLLFLRFARLSTLSRIVCRINVLNLPRTGTVQLDHRFALGRRIVMHRWLKVREPPRSEFGHFLRVETITHPYLDCSRNHLHFLASPMGVWRNLVSVCPLLTL